MGYLYICNSGSDCISKINVNKMREEERIVLHASSGGRVGPHGICAYNGKILTANNYSNTISIIDTHETKKVENYYIGMHCNDLAVFNDEAYITCGELNSVMIFDLKKRRIVEEIPCGNLPHGISIDKKNKIVIISNMESDTITLIDCTDRNNIMNIKVGKYPTQAVFTVDSEYALICESNIGVDYKGSISIISLKNYKIIDRIPTGNSPVDIYCNKDKCFVSNFGDGTVSIIDISKRKVIKEINVGGMPRGIISIDKFIYVGDNYNNILIQVDTICNMKKVINVGKEPTGMIIT